MPSPTGPLPFGLRNATPTRRPGRHLRGAGAALALALVAMPLLPASDAGATDAGAANGAVAQAELEAELSRLEAGMAQLAEQTHALGGPPAVQVAQQSRDLPDGVAAQIQVRLGELEQQMRTLTGQVEQIQHNYNQAARRLDAALNDIEFRLATLEGSSPGEAPTVFEPLTQGSVVGATFAAVPTPSSAQPIPQGQDGQLGTLVVRGNGSGPQVAVEPLESPSTAAQQTVSLPSGTPEDQYTYAYNILASGDYARAERAMRAFVDSNRSHPLASNAQYWLGETYYVRGLFNDAAISFAEGYQLFRTGNKAVDSLLKLGMSLAAMGQRNDACLTLRELQSEFPNAPTAIVRRAQQEIDRLQCS